MTQRSSEKLTVGALGAGQIVCEQHFPVLAALPQVSLAWVADTDKEAASNLANVYQCTSLKPEELTDSVLGGIDILLVAVPYGVRSQYYDRCVRGAQQLSFYIEKPLARTVAEHLQIANIRAPHRVACGYSRRAHHVVRLMKRMIKENFWGTLRECRFGVGGVGGYSVGEKYYSNPGVSGGGLLMEIGVHCLDAVLFCSDGSPVGNITGRMIAENGIDLHTHGTTSLSLIDGTSVPFSFEVSMLKATSGCLEFIFDRHVVSFSLFDDKGIQVKALGSKSGYTVSGIENALTGRQMLASFWIRYLEGLKTGCVNETSSITSLGVTKLVEAAYLLANSSSVNLPSAEDFTIGIPQ